MTRVKIGGEDADEPESENDEMQPEESARPKKREAKKTAKDEASSAAASTKLFNKFGSLALKTKKRPKGKKLAPVVKPSQRRC